MVLRYFSTVFFDNAKTFPFFLFSGPKRLQFPFSKHKNRLCKTPAVIIRELHLKSNLIFAVIGSTSLPSGRHVGKDKGVTVSTVQDVLEELMASHKKTACVIAIRGTVRRSTSDIPRSTESCLKMLGSETVPMMTPESKLSRHRSKCSGPTGMHQSAEPTKGSFHWSGTLLLTSHLAAHAGRSITCQPLTV